MKKKILAAVLTLGMMIGMVGCGSKNPTGITIEGQNYDLSGDFQEVVGSMVEDGLQVTYYLSNFIETHVFDEDGKRYLDEEFDRDEPFIYAMERCESVVPENDDLGSFIHKIYMIDANAEFESKLGFSSESEKKEVKDLDGFMKTTPIKMMKNDAYVALCVDGEMVDFDEYEESFNEWKDAFDGTNSYKDVLVEFFPKLYYPKMVCRMFAADFLSMARSYDEIMERAEDSGFMVKEEIMLAFAMQDACEQLEEGEAKSVVVVKVEVGEDDEVIMEYNEFYFDEDWDPDKFKK